MVDSKKIKGKVKVFRTIFIPDWLLFMNFVYSDEGHNLSFYTKQITDFKGYFVAVSNVKMILDSLIDKGYISTKKEGRQLLISLTSKGVKFLNDKIANISSYTSSNNHARVKIVKRK